MADARGMTHKHLVDQLINGLALCAFCGWGGLLASKPWVILAAIWVSGFWGAISLYRLNRLLAFSDREASHEAPPSD